MSKTDDGGPANKYPDGDLRNVFDAFMALSAELHAEDRRRKELAHLRENAMRKCGSCDKWMKSRECPREHNVNGRNRGPSWNGSPCGQFVSSSSHLEWVEKYETMLAARLAKTEEGT